MPIVSAEAIQTQIYRISCMVTPDIMENVVISPDGLYNIHYVKNGKMETHNGRIVNVCQNRAKPNTSYILFDRACDHSAKRERIFFYQIHMIRDITPNDAYAIAIKHGFKGSVDEWMESLRGPRGYSVYDLAVQEGFEGTVADFLESLKGKDAYQIAVEDGKFEGTKEDWFAQNGDTTVIKQNVENIIQRLAWTEGM